MYIFLDYNENAGIISNFKALTMKLIYLENERGKVIIKVDFIMDYYIDTYGNRKTEIRTATYKYPFSNERLFVNLNEVRDEYKNEALQSDLEEVKYYEHIKKELHDRLINILYVGIMEAIEQQKPLLHLKECINYKVHSKSFINTMSEYIDKIVINK